MSSTAAVEVHGLVKHYGKTRAVDGIDLSVERGEIFALLGPNGAGKTTIVEILEGYRSRDAGSVSVLGWDPATQRRQLKPLIGVVLQSTGVDRYLTVAETIALYSGYYPNPRPRDEVIDHVGLAGQRNTRVIKLSGGQQRRLDVAIALAGNPDLLFLDEPTTGFDPSARHEAWAVVKNLAALGKTVLLTTHYMDEAQHLADRVALITAGRVVAAGAPSSLGDRQLSAPHIRYRLPAASGTSGRDGAMYPPADLSGSVGPDGSIDLVPDDVTLALNRLTSWALEHGIRLDDIEVTRPSLEEVYLSLTGSPSTSGADDASGEARARRRHRRRAP